MPPTTDVVYGHVSDTIIFSVIPLISCVVLLLSLHHCHHVQAQPATLASLVGALNLRTPTHPAAQAALRALGEEECTSISTPPQMEYARPSWTQSLIQSTEASSSGYDDQAPIAAPATVRSAALIA